MHTAALGLHVSALSVPLHHSSGQLPVLAQHRGTCWPCSLGSCMPCLSTGLLYLTSWGLVGLCGSGWGSQRCRECLPVLPTTPILLGPGRNSGSPGAFSLPLKQGGGIWSVRASWHCPFSSRVQKRRSGRQVKRRKYNEDLDFKVVDDDGETIAVLGAGRTSALSASTLAWQAEVVLGWGWGFCLMCSIPKCQC